MRSHLSSLATSRRSLLKASVIICVAQVAAPFVIKGRGETPIRIGVNLPLSGTYAAYGKNEQIGCELAAEEINSEGGILVAPSSCCSRTLQASIPERPC